MGNKITSYKDLKCWQLGHQLVIRIYKETSKFPSEEKYGLVSQMRRCAVSITSNFAEGFSRKGKKEKVQFYYISIASLSELSNQVLISKDLDFIELNTFDEIESLLISVEKLTNALISSIKRKH